MEFSLKYNGKSYQVSFTMTEDDRAKVYYLELTDPDLSKALGNNMTTITYSKIENKYDPQAVPGKAAELQASLINALEVAEKNVR